MNERDLPIDDPALEAYLDGRLSTDEAEQFAASLREDPPRRKQAELQSQVDASLQRLCAASAPDEDHVQHVAKMMAVKAETHSAVRGPIQFSWALGISAAVAVVLVMLAIRFGGNDRPTPFFAPTPVAQLYREEIADGFEPYYECRDPLRFAEVFRRRQGLALVLRPMPAGSRMLGLSYAGGMSRDTTAMLCEIDEQPVMVFVDRAERDNRQVATADAPPAVHVFRVVRDGLVFYEVSPFDSPRAIPFLALAVDDHHGPDREN